MMEFSIEEINTRINEEFCQKTCDLLSDSSLEEKYKNSKSAQKKTDELKKIMKNVGISEEQIDQVIVKYKEKLVPSGAKGVIRGIEFNKIIKEKILKMNLDENFDIQFEKNLPNITTDEIPDWYIYDKKTEKVIIGMNQIDLWSGGAQTNRGYKYLFENKINSEKIKFLCVVCNYKKIIKRGTKVYNIFNTGFKNETISYITNLEKIIYDFFNL